MIKKEEAKLPSSKRYISISTAPVSVVGVRRLSGT